MIRAENYSVRLGDFYMEKTDLSIADGEIFALLGETGSGKRSAARLKRAPTEDTQERQAQHSAPCSWGWDDTADLTYRVRLHRTAL